jgi:hypothetical protein
MKERKKRIQFIMLFSETAAGHWSLKVEKQQETLIQVLTVYLSL